jgi:MSHA biogenesis protein MshG
VRGTIDAPDASAVADQLLGSGVTPVRIEPSSALSIAPEGGPQWWRSLTRPRITLVDLMLFSRQMHTLLKSGVPILRALAGLQDSTFNLALKEIIGAIRADLEAGRELSVALHRHPKVFGEFYVNLVRVGEATGRLDEVFLRLFEYLEFEKDMRDRVKTALRYPAFVVAAMAAAVMLINVLVVPVFARIFEGFKAELPLPTRLLLGFSDFMVGYWYLLIALAFGAWIAFRAWTGTPAGRLAWDRLKLRIPIAGKIVLKATLARFARSLALSLRSGVPVVQGLNTVSRVVENDFIAERIESMRAGVERGESVLRTASAAGVFTPVVLQMVAVGDETGELDDMMLEVAQLYEREVDYELKTLASQIEPILIVFLGAMVLVLALAVFLPIWDLGRVALKR